MFMLIHLGEADTIALSLFDEETIVEKKEKGRNRELLEIIDSFFEQENMNKKDVQGIMVVVGVGGFTSTRLAVTVANTFSFALHIPVLAISEDQSHDPQSLIPSLLNQVPGQFISATYSGMPNLGPSK